MVYCCLKRKPSQEIFKYHVLAQLLQASLLINAKHFQLRVHSLRLKDAKKEICYESFT